MILRVTVEIVPFGDEDEKYEISRLEIFNKGHAEFGHCEYGVIEINKERETAGLHTKDVLHRRDLGAWQLIKKVIEELEIH